jgi:flagellar hook capping protein FlgD
MAFSGLVVATIGAFFVTQHLKVTTPLIAGVRGATPAWINPVDGVTCGPASDAVNHRLTRVSFYLLHSSDYVDVWIVNRSGAVVRTLASSRYMRGGAHPVRTVFTWFGREDNGSIAPDGSYNVKVALLEQGRTAQLSRPSGAPLIITVRTVPPHPFVTGVTPSVIPLGGSWRVTIHYRGNESRSGTVRIYHTGTAGGARLVKSFLTPWRSQSAVWDGTLYGVRASPGTYFVGLDVTDAACNTGHFPSVLPPVPSTNPQAVVTVR